MSNKVYIKNKSKEQHSITNVVVAVHRPEATPHKKKKTIKMFCHKIQYKTFNLLLIVPFIIM